ncbi:MAG TPA: hypothetical protein VJ813_05395 [Vicinamibacterales bacterium]|nr:hypothetical protein [Vicinamibacterales bacterium]
MPDDSLRELIESVRTRFQAELDAQLGALADRHQSALAAAHAEVEQRVGAEVTKVRIDADRHLAEETNRLRVESDQRVAAEVTKVRHEAERHLAEEATRLRAEADQRAARVHVEAEKRVASAVAVAAQLQPGSLLHAFREIEVATTASDVLTAIARAGAAQSPRAALFIANGSRLDRWTAEGLESVEGETTADEVLAILKKALETGTVVRNNGASVAAPLLLDGTAVGVLYGDKGDGGTEPWAEILEAVARYGAAHLGYLTALRTAQARAWIGRQHPSGNGQEDAQSARRYARLVVSEIKLYNEAAVRDGRSHRDLLRRLAPEVERARRLYEERVPSTVPDRDRHFHQELVETLAGGDPSLLG